MQSAGAVGLFLQRSNGITALYYQTLSVRWVQVKAEYCGSSPAMQ
jgi:hypothetical protein